ncbi:MAG: hypothetical protein WKF89_09365 [Chitinophagaceae bacterium]
MSGINLFISYSHRDNTDLEQLKEYLSLIKFCFNPGQVIIQTIVIIRMIEAFDIYRLRACAAAIPGLNRGAGYN